MVIVDEKTYYPYYFLKNYFWRVHNRIQLRHSLFCNIFVVILAFYGLGSLLIFSLVSPGVTNYKVVTLTLSYIISLFVGQSVMICIWRMSKSLPLVIAEMNNNTYFPHDDIEFNRKLKLTNTLFRISNLFSAIFLYMYIYFELQDCTGQPNTGGCGLTFPMYFYGDFLVRPLRDIVHGMFNFYCGYVYVGINCVLGALVQILLYMHYGVKHLITMIRRLKTIENFRRRRHEFNHIYTFHIKLLSIWGQTAAIYKWLMFIQVVLTSLILSLIIVTQLIEPDKYSTFHAFLYIISTIFLAIVGEHITDISEELRQETFYHIPWDGDNFITTRLIFMNLKCSYLLGLPIGNYRMYSLTIAVSIFKMAYSIITFYNSADTG